MREYVPIMMTLTLSSGLKHSVNIGEVAAVTQLVSDGPAKSGAMRSLVRMSCEMGEESLAVAESHDMICAQIDAYHRFMLGFDNGPV